MKNEEKKYEENLNDTAKSEEVEIENEGCCCQGECDCGDECTCGDECDCGSDCHCGDDCDCQNGGECTCGEDCQCGNEEEKCSCHECEDEHTKKHHHKHHRHSEECDDECCCGHHHEENPYLIMAQHLQADFDNYRKRVAEQLDYQREEGKRSVIEVFLPCLDTFKEAKKSITDENVLAGVNMIEEKIYNALKSLNVEKIETIGQKFDHNLHEVVAVYCDESKDNDIILEEFQAGYKLNGKVIRYSKVIVNKKGE